MFQVKCLLSRVICVGVRSTMRSRTVVFSAINGVLMTVVSILSVGEAPAEVWGTKSREYDQLPATLFFFQEDGSGLTEVAPVTLAGTQIVVDGLAMMRDSTLLGFEVSGSTSRLIMIDKSFATATVIGPVLAGRDIRGAVSTADGRLITLDALQNEVVEIDPLTGKVSESGGIPLTMEEEPYDIENYTDIAQAFNGSFLIGGGRGNGSTLCSLDIVTGNVSLVYTDTVKAPHDDWIPAFYGLTFSPHSPDVNTLFVYDAQQADDIFAYQTDGGFSRSPLHLNIISAYNGGRGDLASMPVPEPASLSMLAIGGLVLILIRRRRHTA